MLTAYGKTPGWYKLEAVGGGSLKLVLSAYPAYDLMMGVRPGARVRLMNVHPIYISGRLRVSETDSFLCRARQTDTHTHVHQRTHTGKELQWRNSWIGLYGVPFMPMTWWVGGWCQGFGACMQSSVEVLGFGPHHHPFRPFRPLRPAGARERPLSKWCRGR